MLKLNSLALTLLSFCPLMVHASPPATNSAPTADQILKDVEKHMNAKDESAKVVMTIQEPNGTSKTREIEILRKAGDTPKVMVKLESPPDLRGTALLSIGRKGRGEDQWLYLPSTKQTRRIVSSNKSSGFLDSEMSYEDMGSSSDKKFTNKIINTEKTPQGPVVTIESQLASGDSNYSKVVTQVATKDDLVNRIDYYDRKGALLKTTEMSDYKKFPGDIWRAQTVSVKNAQNHRGTTLQLKDLQINKGLDDSEFTQSAMAD
jgi:outer membrane lipoprotein-sorting protein